MPAASQPRILIIGDAVAPTGFARVIRSIFTPLHGKYEIHQLATRYDGREHDYPWKLYPADSGTSVYGYDRLPELVDQIRPAIIFVLYDFVFLVKYMEILRKCRRDAEIIQYCPIESGPIAPEWMRQLEGVSRFVQFTEYGRTQIAESLGHVRGSEPDFNFPELEVIPHGLDEGRFFPLPDQPPTGRRQIARQSMGLGDDEHRDAFIVLNANRNMPRKRIDLTMQGFALFAKDKPANVKLYLHMATEDSGWNVVILANRLNIYDRLIMTRADNSVPELSDERLNLLYNACDVGITTTTGEGWGMVAFEHAATKSAQVMPRHTSLCELWKDAAEFVEPTTTLTYPGNLTEAHLVSPIDIAHALQRVYEDPDYRESLAEAGIRNATRPDLDWASIAAQWDRLFDQVLTES